NHLLPTRKPGIEFVECGMCHELHKMSGTLTGNTTLSTNTITPGTANNKSFLRANVGKYVDPDYLLDKEAWPKAFLHTDQPKRVDLNLNNDPVQPAITPERAVEGGTAVTARGYCQVCHTMTAYHRNNPLTGASEPADYSKNGLMQCHDGSTDNLACAEEVDCGDCHEHNNNFKGVNSNLPCEQCHDQSQGARPIITTQFDTANVLSSHIPNGTPTKPDCVVCHGQHTHDGFVYGFNVDDGSTSYGTDAADTLSTGAGEVYAPHCLSCHDGFADSLADDSPAPTAGQTRRSPFINSNQPPEIDATAWSTASHNIPTPNATPMTCIGNGTNGCHGSGHGSDQDSLLAPATGTKLSLTEFCVNCHDSDGPSSIDVLAQFSSATNFRVESADRNGPPINQRHDAFDVDNSAIYPNYGGSNFPSDPVGDQTYSSSAVSCANCHSPHVDSSNMVGSDKYNNIADPDTGLPLANYSATGSYTDCSAGNCGGGAVDFSYNSAAGNLDPTNPEGLAGGRLEPDYIQFCLTCHDGSTPPGVTMNAASINIAEIWSGGSQNNDVHGPADNGGTGTSINKGGMKYPWVTAGQVGNDPSAPYASINCTTCHGAHGSDNIFNLRTSIKVAGVQMSIGGTGNMPIPARITDPTVYDLPRTNEITSGVFAQETFDWGAWCTFCHDMSAHAGKVETSTGCNGGHMHGGGAF
ncbi:MAG: hypothetical protein V3R81_07135, partial [Gammaproteobacteria bacterium]